jgi:SAM-dependent methyltransferase
MKDVNEFERLVREAWEAPFSGWDFSWLSGRCHEDSPSWSYRERVMPRVRSVSALLDMGTGGGEFLAGLAPLPADTCATEAYAPNVPIARARLEPLGVEVAQINSDENLPFADGRFECILNRHESFAPGELARLLKPGGVFITQQVGGRNEIRLNELFQDPNPPPYADWTLEEAARGLRQAGLEIMQRLEEFPAAVFDDIGAVVYYLKAIPWQIEGFHPDTAMERLAAVHELIEREGPLVVLCHRFFIEAKK